MQGNRGGQGAGQGGGAGQGSGSGKGYGRGLGLGGSCVCQNCGHREPHQRGVPCYNRKCPKCDAPLFREE